MSASLLYSHLHYRLLHWVSTGWCMVCVLSTLVPPSYDNSPRAADVSRCDVSWGNLIWSLLCNSCLYGLVHDWFLWPFICFRFVTLRKWMAFGREMRLWRTAPPSVFQWTLISQGCFFTWPWDMTWIWIFKVKYTSDSRVSKPGGWRYKQIPSLYVSLQRGKSPGFRRLWWKMISTFNVMVTEECLLMFFYLVMTANVLQQLWKLHGTWWTEHYIFSIQRTTHRNLHLSVLQGIWQLK